MGTATTKPNQTDVPADYELIVAGDPLLPHHRRELQSSGLSPETIAAAGVYSEEDADVLAAALGLSRPDESLVPALAFPHRSPDDAASEFRRFKPDEPRRVGGRVVKYESPRGRGNRLYLPPDAWEALQDPEIPLGIVEGEKKALKITQEGLACISIPGVYGWKAAGEERLIDDLAKIAWAGREVAIIFDSDGRKNPDVRRAANRLAERLTAAGAAVRVLFLPAATNGVGKVGADDYLVRYGPQAFRALLDEAGPAGSVEDETRPKASALDPAEVAAELQSRWTVDGAPTVRHWNGAWHAWNGAAFEPLSESRMEDRVVGALGPIATHVTRTHAANITMHLRGRVSLPDSTRPGEFVHGPPPPGWKPRDCFTAANGLVHLPSVRGGGPCLMPHTPRLFTTSVSPVPFTPEAARPDRWLRFLHEEVFPGRPEEVRLLRQFIGSHLTPDFRYQKALFLFGTGRSGKGTILKTIEMLLGEDAVSAMSIDKLSERFALQSLLGKRAVVMGDVRITRRTGSGAVERLLSITGQDKLYVDRKNVEAVTCRLPVTLALASNELPVLPDASAAVARRFLPVEFVRSFEGNEDLELEDALRGELPGILLWAFGGWEDLRAAGRFSVSAATEKHRETMASLSSPVLAFVREKCERGAALSIPTEKLRESYAAYCAANGYRVPDSAEFGRLLIAAAPGVDNRQRRAAGGREQAYFGIALRGG